MPPRVDRRCTNWRCGEPLASKTAALSHHLERLRELEADHVLVLHELPQLIANRPLARYLDTLFGIGNRLGAIAQGSPGLRAPQVEIRQRATVRSRGRRRLGHAVALRDGCGSGFC